MQELDVILMKVRCMVIELGAAIELQLQNHKDMIIHQYVENHKVLALNIQS